MKLFDEVSLSARNLARRKGRTALTVIGVVVGTCAVIVMISLGIAQNKANEEMLQNWGDLTQIQIYSGGVVSTGGEPAKLDDKAITDFRKMEHVVTATPQYQAYDISGTITAGRNGRYTTDAYNLIGMYADAMEPMGYTLADGDWIKSGQSYGKDKLPVMVTEGTVYNFQDSRRSQNSPKRYRYLGMTDSAGNQVPAFVDLNKDTMTLTITDGAESAPKTKSWELVVVGTIASDMAKGWWTQSGMMMRLEDLKMVAKEYGDLTKNHSATNSNTYNEVYLKVDDVKNVEAVDAALKDLGYSTYSMTQQREEMQKQVGRSQLMLGGLAAISLLVAALNIANTMTMAIYERTREIGVMKVLGCELGNIRTMFLIESGFIGFIGGVAGSVISLGVGFILNHITTIMAFFGQSGGSGSMGGTVISMGSSSMYMSGDSGATVLSVIPPWLILAALVFATVIGLLSGAAPANRAVKISALEAIRHD